MPPTAGGYLPNSNCVWEVIYQASPYITITAASLDTEAGWAAAVLAESCVLANLASRLTASGQLARWQLGWPSCSCKQCWRLLLLLPLLLDKLLPGE